MRALSPVLGPLLDAIRFGEPFDIFDDEPDLAGPADVTVPAVPEAA